jgi:hypothetical protein
VVPERIQHAATADRLAADLEAVRSPGVAAVQRRALAEVRERLGDGRGDAGALDRLADLAVGMLRSD